jgi:CBS domain-containing membrane protein
MKVAEIMHTKLKTIAADATVADAVAVLSDTGVSALPVVDRLGRAVGVCSTRDVLQAEGQCHDPMSRDHLFSRTLVLEIMTPWPHTVHPDEDVRSVAGRMLDQKVQRFFVEDRGALVGVISQTDIVAAVAATRV